jgi:hypothetical protein
LTPGLTRLLRAESILLTSAESADDKTAIPYRPEFLGTVEKPWRPNPLPASEVSAARQALAAFDAYLRPQDWEDSGRAMRAIAALLSYYRQPDRALELEVDIAAQWGEDVEDYPLWTVLEVCRLWRRDPTNRRAPYPGEFRSLCEPLVAEARQQRDRLQRCLELPPRLAAPKPLTDAERAALEERRKAERTAELAHFEDWKAQMVAEGKWPGSAAKQHSASKADNAAAPIATTTSNDRPLAATLLQRGDFGHKEPFPASGLRNADGVRASEVEPVVQEPDRDGGLDVPLIIGPEAQGAADDAFPAAEEGLDPDADIVPGGCLPSHPSMFDDVLEVPTALRRVGPGACAQHRRGAGRHDHNGIGRVLRHGSGHHGLVVGPVHNKGRKGLVHLVQQRADLRAIVHVVIGQGRCYNPPSGGIQPDVQLLPGKPAPGPAFLDQPLAGTAQRHAGAVDQQFHGSRRGGRHDRQTHDLGTPADSGTVGNSKFHTEQVNDGADQAFGLAQREPEHSAQGQCRRNRQIRVEALTTGCGPRLRSPALDRLRHKSDRQAAPRPKPHVVLRPVANPMALLRIKMTARRIGFERHGRTYTEVKGWPLRDSMEVDGGRRLVS